MDPSCRIIARNVLRTRASAGDFELTYPVEDTNGGHESVLSPERIQGASLNESDRDLERAELRNALERKSSELEEVSNRRENLAREIRDLQARLGVGESQAAHADLAAAPTPAPRPQTNRAKIELFRSLFRGREDVYPRWFHFEETGKSGYAPVRDYDRERSGRGGSNGKRVAPGYRLYKPLTDDVIFAHLKGRDFIGVYPLLEDETCWFLAVDLDGRHWGPDASAFRSAAAREGVAVAIERSRSGDGAHAWVFFEEPVPAWVARRFGSYLISVAMDSRHEISMESYDRLFPNQDTMPDGGFGNLIALPFHGKAQALGNTLFLDEHLNPFPDQWGFLAGVERVGLQKAKTLSAKAKEYEGFKTPRSEPDLDQALGLPWKLTPSRRPAPVAARLSGPLPEVVEAHLANRLFVSKTGLESPVINAMKRLAVLQNPAFYSKQRQRMPTYKTPRIIPCFEEFPDHVGLPRGCVPDVEGFFESLGSKLSIVEVRETGAEINVGFNARLSGEQSKSLKKLMSGDIGVLVAPPGSGKTAVAIAAIAQRARSTLILVHTRQLMDHWIEQLTKLLGEDGSEFGRIGGGNRKITGRIDVATFQSLARGGEVKDLVADYGHVVVDECHHVPARTFAQVLSEVKARYAIGLTATPKRKDGLQAIISMQLGPLRKAAGSSAPLQAALAKRLLVRETEFEVPTPGGRTTSRIFVRWSSATKAGIGKSSATWSTRLPKAERRSF